MQQSQSVETNQWMKHVLKKTKAHAKHGRQNMKKSENCAPFMLSNQLMNDFFIDWCTLKHCILFSMCPTPTMIGIMQSTKAINFRPELSCDEKQWKAIENDSLGTNSWKGGAPDCPTSWKRVSSQGRERLFPCLQTSNEDAGFYNQRKLFFFRKVGLSHELGCSHTWWNIPYDLSPGVSKKCISSCDTTNAAKAVSPLAF